MALTITNRTEEARKTFNMVSSAENATAEQINEALEAYVTAVAEDAGKQVRAEYEELKDVHDSSILQARGIPVLTAAETKFYNEAIKKSGFDEEMVWPETILERVFYDIQKDHPILRLVKFSPTIGRLKVIKSRRKGVAVFGPLHKDIEGQLDAEFGATEYVQLALTAFFLISKDTLDLGPRWIDRYVLLCLREAVRDIWATKIITGTGNNEPIGLLKNMNGAVTDGVYPDKDPEGTLTFADSKTMVMELAAVMKKLSKYTRKISPTDPGTEEYRAVDGKVYLIINPSDYYDIVPRATVQTQTGTFVTNLPFIPVDHIIQSTDVPAKKLIAYVDGEYEATQSQAEKVYEYRETFAMKRAVLYAIDMLGNGQPSNNDAAHIYDIAIPPSNP